MLGKREEDREEEERAERKKKGFCYSISMKSD
jgi:hypothetical protein